MGSTSRLELVAYLDLEEDGVFILVSPCYAQLNFKCFKRSSKDGSSALEKLSILCNGILFLTTQVCIVKREVILTRRYKNLIELKLSFK